MILPETTTGEPVERPLREDRKTQRGNVVALRDWGSRTDQLDVTGLLGTLGFTGNEHVGLLAIARDGTRQSAVRPLSEVYDYIADLGDDLNVFVGVNPVTGPARDGERGTADDVTRVATLVADIDVKPGACPDLATALRIVAEVSAIIGEQPTAITYSGHGIHAYWATRDGQITNTGEAAAILKRFGRLVKSVGQKHGARLDSVFDLARVLRAPGTFNNKDVGKPGILVRTVEGDGKPVSLAQVVAVLDERGHVELEGDRRTAPGQVVSGSATWGFAEATCSYVRKMVDGLDDDGPRVEGDGRHQWAGNQANRFASAWRLGCITETDWQTAQRSMDARLIELRSVTGEDAPASEIPGWFEWAIENVELKTDAETREELRNHQHPKPIDEEAFWESCGELRNLRQFARARQVGPWAMLGAVLAITTAAIPPHVVLPPLVGSHASLNLYVALVGASGRIKSAAIAAAQDWLITNPVPNPCKPGSGEGLAKCFAYVEKPRNEPARQVGKSWTVVAVIAEVDALTATGSRSGSTYMAELRSAWSGERLGFDYAAQDKVITLAAHRYRLAMIVGVQPARSGSLFDDADGGTPQRFVWLPTTDPTRPEHLPAEPAPMPLDLAARFDPQVAEDGLLVDQDVRRRSQLGVPPDKNAFHVLRVPTAVEQAVKEHTARALSDKQPDEALDAHVILCREKVAASLAILRGHDDEITEEDWELASVVMAVSERTRREAQNVVKAEREKRQTASGKASGIRRVAEADTVADVEAERRKQIGMKVCTKLAAAEGKTLTGAKLRSALDPAVRPMLVEVLDDLEAEGRVTMTTAQQGQKGVRVTLIDATEQTR